MDGAIDRLFTQNVRAHHVLLGVRWTDGAHAVLLPVAERPERTVAMDFYGPDHHHLAVSGESYESEAACLVAINNLIRMSGNAAIHSAPEGTTRRNRLKTHAVCILAVRVNVLGRWQSA